MDYDVQQIKRVTSVKYTVNRKKESQFFDEPRNKERCWWIKRSIEKRDTEVYKPRNFFSISEGLIKEQNTYLRHENGR